MKNLKTMVSELGEVDVIVATFEKVEWLNFYIFFEVEEDELLFQNIQSVL